MLSENAINFLLYSYFGIKLGDLTSENKEKIILTCAQRAYKDLCRTLEFREKTSTSGLSALKKREIKDSHEKFCDEICEEIRRLVSESLLTADVDSFDERHKKACNQICCKAKKSDVLNVKPNGDGKEKEFYYGQAQKWLNMTMKYMWLLGLWEDRFAKMLPVLHVPVDSYIMEAASDLGVDIPTRAGSKGKYGSGKSKPWSQWGDEEYRTFQTGLREALKSQVPQVPQEPLKWEGPAWINIAQQRAEN